MLVGNEGLDLIDIITDFTISESQMVSLVQSSVSGCKQVRNGEIEELWHVDDVEELGAVANVEPHPVTVGLQAHGFQSQQFQEVGTKQQQRLGGSGQ